MKTIKVNDIDTIRDSFPGWDTNTTYTRRLGENKGVLELVEPPYPEWYSHTNGYRLDIVPQGREVLEEAEYNEEGNVTKEAVLGDYIFEVTYPSGYELPEIISLHTCKNIDELKAWIRGRGLDKQFDLRKSFQNLFNDVYEYLRSL